MEAFLFWYAPEDYVHRIGRTGRAGASGLAVSLVSPDEERLLAGIERFIKRDLNASPLPEFAPPAQPVRPTPAAVPNPVPSTSSATALQTSGSRFGRSRAEPVCALLLPPANPVEASPPAASQA